MSRVEAEGCNKTGQYGRSGYTPAAASDIVAQMIPRHGVLALYELRSLGLSDSAVHKRARTGHLHRIHPAVYALVPRALLSREGLWRAAVVSCGPDAVLSHRSAAALHELRPAGGVRVDVTVPRRLRPRPGLHIHSSRTLTRADLTVVRNVPCTSVARTLLDLGGVLDRRALERACDQAEILEAFDLTAIQDQIARNPHRRGATALTQILAEHDVGQTPTWSELEERFLALTRQIGLPDPRVNEFIDPHDGEPAIRVDFAWPEHRLVVEADGKRTHLTHQAFESDRRRDQRLVAAGWRVIRTTWHQIVSAPAELARTLIAIY